MSIYAGIPLLTLQGHLAEAQLALHQISTGKLVQLLVADGDRFSFHPSDNDKLRRYIRELQTAIAVLQGQPAPGLASVATWTRAQNRGPRWDA